MGIKDKLFDPDPCFIPTRFRACFESVKILESTGRQCLEGIATTDAVTQELLFCPLGCMSFMEEYITSACPFEELPFGVAAGLKSQMERITETVACHDECYDVTGKVVAELLEACLSVDADHVQCIKDLAYLLGD